MSTLSFSHNAQNNRMYLGINRESIWITRPSDEQLETLRTKTLEDVQVVRFKSESRTLYYLKCDDYSSMISAPQAAKILFAQGRIKAEEMSKITKPEQFDKIAQLHTVQQVPYWIEAVQEELEKFPNRPTIAEMRYVLKYKEHHFAKFKSRAEAQKALKMLTELGQPTVHDGTVSFQNSTFTLKTINWYGLNPCTKFIHLRGGTLPRTQFSNLCTALVPYLSALPVPASAIAAAPSVRTKADRKSRTPKKKAAPSTTKAPSPKTASAVQPSKKSSKNKAAKTKAATTKKK